MVDFRKGREDRGGSMRDRARKRAEERESRGGGGTKYNLPENVTFFSPKKHATLDILPYTVSVDNHPEDVPKGEQWYQRTIFVHFGVGTEEKSYLCLKTIKKKCPICTHRSQMMNDPNADEEIVKQLRAKERELFNVYDQDDPDKGVQLWDISNYNFGAKLEEELREGRSEWAGFAEPVDGFTLKVRFSEEQIGKTKYMQASRIDFEERKSLDKKLLSQVLDLDKILKVLSYEQLEKIFLGVDGENGEEVSSKGEVGGSVGGDEEQETSSDRGRSMERATRREQREQEKPQPSESVRGRGREKSVEKEAPPERARPARAAKADDDKPVCPVKGGTFGKDCDEYKECRTCDIWEKCIEEQERLAK